MLELKDLFVEVEGKDILKGINLKLGSNEAVALFGPNGSGKSTLLNSLVGLNKYKIKSGEILFDNELLNEKSIDYRVNKGIAISFQNPPEVTGVSLKNMINICLKRSPNIPLLDEMPLIKKFKLQDFLNRDINVGFSGGERKRADILQMLLLKPKLLLLDEPDSGVDVESLKLIANEIRDYVKANRASLIVITHHGQILEYLKVNKAFVLIDGKIHCFNNAKKVLEHIKAFGYEKCLNCDEALKIRG